MQIYNPTIKCMGYSGGLVSRGSQDQILVRILFACNCKYDTDHCSSIFFLV